MYGYILVNKPELKIKEYTLYQSYYCGLCHSIKDQYGNIPRLTLSYDLTFLTVLLTSLYECDDNYQQLKCLKKLGQKRHVIQNEITSYVADISILLAYLKCKDDIQDENSFKAKVMKFFLTKDYENLRIKYPEKMKHIEEAISSLTVEEFKQNHNIDYMASYFGKIFGEVFAYKKDMWYETLYNIGYYLGEFIYVLDAFDDLEDDRKNQRYNPFIQLSEDEVNLQVKEILDILIGECTDYFERLPIIENIDLLRNILYSGIWNKYYEKINQQKGQEDGSL